MIYDLLKRFPLDMDQLIFFTTHLYSCRILSNYEFSIYNILTCKGEYKCYWKVYKIQLIFLKT